MAYVVEADDKGSLVVPPELRDIVRPHSRYVLEVQGDLLILRPEERKPFWATATPEQRKRAFLEWVASHRGGPGLPDEALHRDTMYD
jgi:hypothetical protein